MKAKVTINAIDIYGKYWAEIRWPAHMEFGHRNSLTTKGYKSRSACRRAVNKFLKRNGLQEVKDG